MKLTTRRLTELALLTAAALIIFVIELRIPDLVPIPGVKLGLANIITVYAVFRYKPGETALIVLCRILLGSMFAGRPSAILYSAAGAALCLIGMLAVRRFIPPKWIWLCSVLGAIFHNTGQILAAMVLMKTAVIVSYIPVLLFTGCIAGAFTGLCAQMLVARIDRKPPA
ncbi:MAG: Gx transporter family protein [Oscillospiraceae bacterium]|nr:Gx transporter family protein [Oscillospiraceae bacterium]